MTTLRLILGDQLNSQHHWFQDVNKHISYLLIECRSETDYTVHHIQKICAFFKAMRLFAAELQSKGHKVIYITLDHPENQGSLAQNWLFQAKKLSVKKIGYLLPDEYRVDQALSEAAADSGMEVEVADTDHFLTTRTDFGAIFSNRKQYIMEHFYRTMRTKYHILMDEYAQPVGGKWNFDHDNRNAWKGTPGVPELPNIANDVSDIYQMLVKEGISYIGDIKEKELPWPVDAAQAKQLIQHFIEYLLPYFGSYQDAMHTQETYLFHSRLSFALNIKLIHPLEVVKAVETAWKANPDDIQLSQAEGFIRQIIGWREYMRGVYWNKMPGYKHLNYFEHKRPLPSWFWTGETKMNCLRHAITNSLQNAYAHHIQRLMVIGNFALLAGIDPDEIDQWYLGIYIDALEWVEITNTRGMSQFADGGIVGTKPYVSSANYIDKMSNYCTSCHYNKKLKTGDKACPFNSLYWHFYHRHHDKLANNPRIGMMYITWDKMSSTVQSEMIQQAERYLADAEHL